MSFVNVIGKAYRTPTTLMFAKSGVEVVGTDYNEELLDLFKRGN